VGGVYICVRDVEEILIGRGGRSVMKQCESGWHIVGDGITLKSRS